MSANLSSAFLRSARVHFAALFTRFGFEEVPARDDLNGAVLVAKGKRFYLQISCDLRDRWVEAAVGQLAEDLVPPPPIAPPREPEDVRLIGSAILAWLSTGDKDRSFSSCAYTEETPEALDRAVGAVADQLERFGALLLQGDRDAWERAAELTVTRQWKP